MNTSVKLRPSPHEYFMGIAMAVRARANCRGKRIGAVLALDNRVISTGYNGTPEDMENCDKGGCYRCLKREEIGPGKGYDTCICVHAEQNALLSAARFGIGVAGSVVYSTMRPCFGCSKELLQAKVEAVYYLYDWEPDDPELLREYEIIQARFPKGVRKLELDDPDKEWALSSKAPMPLDSGHGLPGR